MTTRGWIVRSSLAALLCAHAGAHAQQRPADPPPGHAAPADAGGSQTPRLAPGQVAVYDVRTTAPGATDKAYASRLRVQVLRRTDEGVVVRCSELLTPAKEAADGQPQGPVTIDLLLANGARSRPVDTGAARAELIDAALRKVGGDTKQNSAYAAAVRKGLTDARVEDVAYALAGSLFEGLGGLILVSSHEHTARSSDTPPVVLLRTTAETKAAPGGLYELTATRVVPVEAARRDLRAELALQYPALEGPALDALVAKRTQDAADQRTRTTVTFDPATGWPRSATYTETAPDGDDTRAFTLAEGPTPLVPAPPANPFNTDYARWIVSLVESPEPPLCAYGKHAAETMPDPTPAQRRIFIDAALADNAPPRGAIPPTLVLADAAARSLPADQAPLIEGAFARLTPSARTVVLQRVVYISEQWGRDLFARLLAAAPREGEIADLPAFDAAREPDVAAAALDAYLRAFKAGTFDWGTLYAAYSLRDAGRLEGDLKARAMARAADSLALLLAQIEPEQRAAPGEWVYADAYARRSATAALAADLLGAAEGDTGLDALRRTLTLTDPRPRAFAAAALVLRGQSPDAQTLGAICQSPVGWDALVRTLAAAGKAGAIPAEARTLERAALADMVRWLIYPVELGRTPDAIEQVGALDLATPQGPRRYVIFRFRSSLDGFNEKGWMLGVSGPWDPAKDFSQRAGGETFSAFEPIDVANAQDQARALIDMVKAK